MATTVIRHMFQTNHFDKLDVALSFMSYKCMQTLLSKDFKKIFISFYESFEDLLTFT
jgi:hypothetical protein